MSIAPNIYVAVVDDDDSVCRSLARLLRASGMHPVTYPSAEAFLEDLKQPSFDCLILDIQLGGMSGIELSQKLAAEDSRTPVIFITAHDTPELRAQAMQIPGAAFLKKTAPAEAVLAAIRTAVRPPPTASYGET